MRAMGREVGPWGEGEGRQLKNRDKTGISVPEVRCEVRNKCWVIYFSELSYRPVEYSGKPRAPFCP